jgi:hypothetical protein
MKALRPLLLLFLALPLAGCISFDLLVKIRPDGSGTIVRTVVVRTDWIEELGRTMKEAISESGGEVKIESKGKNDFDMFTEKEARDEAAKMGKGVRFVSAKPTKTAKGQGQIAIYAFDDVTKLSLSDEPPAPGMPVSGDDASKVGFVFSRKSGEGSRLAVRMPKNDIKAEADKPDEKGEEAPAPSADDLAQARKILGGLRVAMAVEIEGKVLDVQGGWRDGNRVTLLEMDFDKLLADEKRLASFASKKAKSLEEAQADLKNVPGFRIPTGEEVVIRFR